jgi:hypothetical protein
MQTVSEGSVVLHDGRILHYYDTGAGEGADLAVVWFHGSPNVGEPPEPLLPA